ncbi:MAG: hypothetical protein LQ340_004752 [Diploschistes diacapsis]|nr:MAG: hypothetical protein LQ340_004752 [Diploschistes diacapsis]
MAPILRSQHRKRSLEGDRASPDSAQDNSLFKKRKTDHQQHNEDQTYSPFPPSLLSPPPLSEDRNLPMDYTSPSSPQSLSDGHLAKDYTFPPSLFKDRNLANDCKTVEPDCPATVAPLTRKNLKEFEKMTSLPPSKRSLTSPGSKNSNTTTTSSDRIKATSNHFPQILEDNKIIIDSDPSMLADREELRLERSVRPSLAPSQFSDGEIDDIWHANKHAATEPDIERDVVSAIIGPLRGRRLPHSGNVSWKNMSSMTGGRTVAPQPDLYYGVSVGEVPKVIRDSIGDLIVPSAVPNAPALPHFIVEIKGPTGSLEVVKRQAAHAGAAAAYAAFSLENYGVDNPICDDNTVVHVWTYTSVPGDLTHYGMRIHKPDPDAEPSYHLTLVKTYHITESHEQYRKGVSAFRHCRDDSHKKNHERLAEAIKRLRNSMTPQLNEQASQSNMPA